MRSEQQGTEEGREQAEKSLILRPLTRRVRELPTDVHRRGAGCRRHRAP